MAPQQLALVPIIESLSNLPHTAGVLLAALIGMRFAIPAVVHAVAAMVALFAGDSKRAERAIVVMYMTRPKARGRDGNASAVPVQKSD